MTPNSRTHNANSISQSKKPLVAISMGDPCGIGAEVIVKTLADQELRAMGRFVVFGFDDVLRAAADAAGIKPFWFCVSGDEEIRVDSGVVCRSLEEGTAGYWVQPRPTEKGGLASLRFFDEAIALAKSGEADAIVTGPIHKTSWKLAGCRFAGHTDKLAADLGVKRYTMAFFGGGLRIALATTHIGLMQLRNQFTLGSVYQPIEQLDLALKHWFGIEQPRLAVLGLNPHAGEDGLFGDEEQRVIKPAMQMARNQGINVEGPFPADSFFTPQSRSRFDGVVAMYHDQGLIPVKMLAFDRAVNVTLGLPVVRTSPDHGTAFDIAGTNEADPGSMREAIRLACQVALSNQTPTPPVVPRVPTPAS